MTTVRSTRTPATVAAALVLGLALVPALAGCSSGGGSGADSKTAGSVQDAPAAAAAPERAQTYDGAGVADALQRGTASSQVESRALISQGTVSLRDPDVAAARFDVQKVVDRFGGEISDEQTDTDEHGKVLTSHLVVRVPAAHFAEAMDALAKVGDLEYTSSKTRDVTTRVIDTESRLRVQRRSIHRITQLLDRAENLRDIVLIEAQLSQRQAVLDSLERQSAYLADQTSLSTITVDLERTPRHAAKRHEDHTGFLAGLSAGWHGLTAVAVGLATALGALLPFAVVLLVLLALGWPLLRSLRRRRAPADEPVPTTGG